MLKDVIKKETKLEFAGPEILANPTFDVDSIKKTRWLVYSHENNKMTLLQMQQSNIDDAYVFEISNSGLDVKSGNQINGNDLSEFIKANAVKLIVSEVKNKKVIAALTK